MERSEAIVNCLGQRSDGDISGITEYQKNLSTSIVEVELLDGGMTYVQVGLTTAQMELELLMNISPCF